jgi:hypothetical protein
MSAQRREQKGWYFATDMALQIGHGRGLRLAVSGVGSSVIGSPAQVTLNQLK